MEIPLRSCKRKKGEFQLKFYNQYNSKDCVVLFFKEKKKEHSGYKVTLIENTLT